ncbi:MAG: hypothetical protein M3Q36_04050 [bacterium]|nr:hypothetical protein [bacterium]
MNKPIFDPGINIRPDANHGHLTLVGPDFVAPESDPSDWRIYLVGAAVGAAIVVTVTQLSHYYSEKSS